MPLHRLMSAMALVAAACGSADNEPVVLDGTPVALLEYVATAPADWQQRQPGSQMRLAEFTTPAAGDAAAAEVVVYFFGQGQGGDLAANVERWRNQFANDDGTRPEPEITQENGAAFSTTVVKLRGRYARSIGMGDTTTVVRPDQILLAAIVETPRGNLHVQMHGPATTVTAQEPSFRRFISGIRAHSPQS